MNSCSSKLLLKMHFISYFSLVSNIFFNNELNFFLGGRGVISAIVSTLYPSLAQIFCTRVVWSYGQATRTDAREKIWFTLKLQNPRTYVFYFFFLSAFFHYDAMARSVYPHIHTRWKDCIRRRRRRVHASKWQKIFHARLTSTCRARSDGYRVLHAV